MKSHLRAAAFGVLVALALPSIHLAADPLHPGVRVTCSDFRTAATVEVYAERVSASGEVHAGWTADSTRLCLGTGQQYSFAIAPDGAGGAYVAWVEARAQGSDIRAQRLGASGALASGWPAAGVAVCASPRDQYLPRAIADGAGGAYLAWQDFRDDRGRVYLRRLASNGSFPAGWESDGVAVASGGEQSGAVLVADGAGGVLVVWQDYREGKTAIRAQRLIAAGTVASGWPAEGRVVCESGQAQSAPVATSDGAGGLLVVWQEARGGSEPRLYAQRITAEGAQAAVWPASGLALGGPAGAQRLAAIAADGAGGALIAWCGAGDIFLQRASAAGAIAGGWPAGGVAVCAAQGEQYAPAILADGSGGAFVAWEDYRLSGEGDVFAQRVSGAATVAPGWPANGVALCDAEGAQFGPALASDGMGGAIATWFDARSSAIASFASRGQPPGAGPIAFALEGPRPSPARGRLQVALALPDGAPARLELLDVQGRRLAARDVGALGAGRHLVSLGEGRRLRAGVYLVRLTRLGHTLTSNAVVLP